MTEILRKAGEYRLLLERQEDSQSSNPRTNQDCNLTNVITLKGQRYIDVDETGGPLQDGWDHFSERHLDREAIRLFIRWAHTFHGAVVVEDDPHDGARSLWYVMPEKIAEAGTTATPKQIIADEIRQYRMWADGEIYGYAIEKAVGWTRKDKGVGVLVTWDHVDSCWGYIGRTDAERQGREAFEPYAREAGE